MIDKTQPTATEHPLITLTNNKLDKTDNYWRVYYMRQGAGVLYEAGTTYPLQAPVVTAGF
jgi:hypothetical protein